MTLTTYMKSATHNWLGQRAVNRSLDEKSGGFTDNLISVIKFTTFSFKLFATSLLALRLHNRKYCLTYMP